MSGRMRVVVAGVEYPLTLNTSDVAKLFDCSPELLQRQVGSGQLPCEPLRLGNRLRWPTLKVAAAVGLVAEVVEDDGRVMDSQLAASCDGGVGDCRSQVAIGARDDPGHLGPLRSYRGRTSGRDRHD